MCLIHSKRQHTNPAKQYKNNLLSLKRNSPNELFSWGSPTECKSISGAGIDVYPVHPSTVVDVSPLSGSQNGRSESRSTPFRSARTAFSVYLNIRTFSVYSPVGLTWRTPVQTTFVKASETPEDASIRVLILLFNKNCDLIYYLKSYLVNYFLFNENILIYELFL